MRAVPGNRGYWFRYEKSLLKHVCMGALYNPKKQEIKKESYKFNSRFKDGGCIILKPCKLGKVTVALIM